MIEQHDPVGASKIAQRRRAAGLSQARLAGLAGCSRSSIALMECGYRPRRSDVVRRIDAVLDEATAHHDLEPICQDGLEEKTGESGVTSTKLAER